MPAFTSAQDVALERLYQREVDRVASNIEYQKKTGHKLPPEFTTVQWRDVWHVRECARPGPGCIMIKVGSIWLGIEPDGYTHS